MKVFLCLLTVLFLVTGCGKLPNPEAVTSPVRHDNTIVKYGNYLYIAFPVGLPSKYNRTTETMTTLCMDVECENNCILCQCLFFRTLGIQDNKLYFSCGPRGRHNPNLPEWSRGMELIIGYQDQISGKVVPLRTISEAEFAGDYTFLDQGFIYYPRSVLKEGGDPKNSDDYVFTITRLSLDGKNEENLDDLAKAVAGVLIVADGNIYTLGRDNSTIYVSKITDEGVEDPVPLFDVTETGYQDYYDTVPYYYNGTLFFFVTDGAATPFPDPEYSKYWIQTRKNAYLIALNTETGEWKQLVEEPLSQFTVTENKIYYVPIEYRILYAPENYDEIYAQDPVTARNVVKRTSASSKIYCCNLDGSKQKLVLDLPNYTFDEVFCVNDNTLYSWFVDTTSEEYFTSKTHRVQFASLDLSSGKVTFAQEQDNATP